MEEAYSLYYDGVCVAWGYTEEEFQKLLDDLQLELFWDSCGGYGYFLNNHYSYEKEWSC